MEIKLKISNLYPSVNIESLVKNIFDFNIGSALTELIKIESSDERKACLLLFKTIKKTNFELAKQYGQDKLDKEISLFQKSRSLDSEIIIFLEKEVVITKDFFENTTQFNPNYLRASFKLFKNYYCFIEKYQSDLVNIFQKSSTVIYRNYEISVS